MRAEILWIVLGLAVLYFVIKGAVRAGIKSAHPTERKSIDSLNNKWRKLTPEEIAERKNKSARGFPVISPPTQSKDRD